MKVWTTLGGELGKRVRKLLVAEGHETVARLEEAEAVVYLSSLPGDADSMLDPSLYLTDNVTRVAEVLEKAPKTLKRIVVLSSLTAYGDGMHHCDKCMNWLAPEGPRNPDDLRLGRFDVQCPVCQVPARAVPTPEYKQLTPASIHGLTMKFREELVTRYAETFDIPAIVLRTGSLYGPGVRDGAVARFTQRLLEGEAPLVFEDGEQSRDFTHIDDVAAAVVCAVEADESFSGIVNVCTGVDTTLSELLVALEANLTTRIAADITRAYRIGDVRSVVGDPEGAKIMLGWSAQVSLDDGLAEYCDWAQGANPVCVAQQDAEFHQLKLSGVVR
jgi:dTDP-L-rhamnose 4-epimerase